jgi:hypothetical protein
MDLLFINKPPMTSSQKKPFSLTKLLRHACGAFEILMVLGLLIVVVMAPFADSNVSSGSHVTISKSTRTGTFTYAVHPGGNRGTTVTNETSPQSGNVEDEAGSVSVGPFSLSPGKERQFFVGAASDKDVGVQKVEAMVAFKGIARATEALRAFKWPAVASELCAILSGLAFFEMLRRLLSSAEKGDLFTDANVRMLRRIGFLMIALDLAKFGAEAILMGRMNEFVAPFFSGGTWMLSNTVSGKLTGVISGVFVLLLAEVFREGLKFRKDSDLTI